jgi:hypothetical protein
MAPVVGDGLPCRTHLRGHFDLENVTERHLSSAYPFGFRHRNDAAQSNWATGTRRVDDHAALGDLDLASAHEAPRRLPRSLHVRRIDVVKHGPAGL